MSLKKLGAAMAGMLVIGAVMASGASAAATTTAAEWYTGASPGATLKENKTITAKAGTTFTLNATAGTTPITLTATALECVGCSIENKVAKKSGVETTSSVVATGTGTITFKGVTVDTPKECTVSSKTGVEGDITTEPLTVHADFMEGETALQQFFPTTGEAFASFKLGGTGCSAIANTYIVKGTLFSAATNKTGVQAKEQPNKFSPEINKNAGGELKLGSHIAELTGTGVFELGGTLFGIH